MSLAALVRAGPRLCLLSLVLLGRITEEEEEEEEEQVICCGEMSWSLCG